MMDSDSHLVKWQFVILVSSCFQVRNLRRKRRQPYQGIVVGAFLMRIEAQAVKTRPKRRPIETDRIKKSSRLESTVNKVQSHAKKVKL